MRKICLLLAAMLVSTAAQSQPRLSLAEAHRLAIAHLPASRHDSLARRAAELRIASLSARWRPSLAVNAQAAVQSDAVTIGIGPTRIEQPLERYQATLDVNQTLYDGGAVAVGRLIEQAQLAVERQGVLVEHHAVKARVNGYYLAALMSERTRELTDSTLALIERRLQVAEAALRGGTVLPRDVHRLQAERLRLQQRRAELVADRSTLVSILSTLLGTPLSDAVQLVDPDDELRPESELLVRPELRLFDLQQRALSERQGQVATAYRPRVSAFAQGGAGYPNPLNFPDIQFRPFGQVGLRLSWTLSSWGTARRDRELLGLQSAQVAIQRETFEQNLRIALAQEQGQAAKLAELLQRDEALIELQRRVTRETLAQYEHGVATITDYLAELNAEHQALLSRALHRLQQTQSRINRLSLKGQL